MTVAGAEYDKDAMRRQILLVFAVAAAFGLLLPAYKGYGFLDRRIIIAYACLGAVFAAPGATDAFVEPPASPLRTMMRVWLLSWAYATAILAIGLMVINLPAHGPSPLLPRTSLLVAAECLGLTLTAAVTVIAAVLTRRLSGASTIRIFRSVFLAIIAIIFLVDRYVPGSMTTPAVVRALFIISAVCGAAALVAAARYPETSPQPGPEKV